MLRSARRTAEPTHVARISSDVKRAGLELRPYIGRHNHGGYFSSFRTVHFTHIDALDACARRQESRPGYARRPCLIMEGDARWKENLLRRFREIECVA